eukprot:247976_1
MSDYKHLNIYNIPSPYDNNNLYFCYAPKSHPELISYDYKNQLIFTYVCNSWNVDVLFKPGNGTIYIPQFVTVNFTAKNNVISDDENKTWIYIGIVFIVFVGICLFIGCLLKWRKQKKIKPIEYIRIERDSSVN